MSDGDALLRAVIENPADDAPRLVYADWCEEHGDPDRAEFIRVQIGAGRGQISGVEASCRGAELLNRHWVEWFGPLLEAAGKLAAKYRLVPLHDSSGPTEWEISNLDDKSPESPDLCAVTIRRGFADEAGVWGSAPADLAVFLRQTPLAKLYLGSGASIGDAARLGHLRFLRSLDLWYCPRQVVESLNASSDQLTVRELELIDGARWDGTEPVLLVLVAGRWTDRVETATFWLDDSGYGAAYTLTTGRWTELKQLRVQIDQPAGSDAAGEIRELFANRFGDGLQSLCVTVRPN
jgi:uncharacterized protein (TIGR02996 family)